MRCNFCNEKIPEGRARIFVTKAGKAFYYCGSKCLKNSKIRKPGKVKWVQKEKKVKKETVKK